MSRTVKGSKGPGFDYWTKRHPANGILGHGKYVKKITHRYERREAARDVRERMKDLA